MAAKNKIQKAVHWLLLALIAAYIITGLGITEYHIVEAITLGILTKNISFQIHYILLIPFLALLALHIWFVLKNRSKKK